MARRILSLWLPALAMDRWRLAHAGEDDTQPRVLISDTAHGPRIEAANRAGMAAGARKGMMLADARTLCPVLQTAPADPAGDLAFLEQLAVWAMRWGPWSAMDPPDGLLIDVTAVPHLFGGEAKLLEDVHAVFAQRGLALRSAIAPTAGAAWACAHYGSARTIVGGVSNASLRAAQPRGNPARNASTRSALWIAASPPAPRNDEEEIRRALSDLPVAALRLDEDVLTVLRRLGIKRLGQLDAIEENGAGRDAIQRRFRNRKSPAANPLIRLDQLLGRVPEPLLPVVPQQAPLVQRRLMEPIRHRNLLDTVLEDLALDMARELEGKALGARRLELGLWRVDGEVL
ncbi:MAG: DNA polymerase Y family protein, partial [Erythrobacter sp.]|nr:DNA polymerase Y family protein [Erythrobacter sp.]